VWAPSAQRVEVVVAGKAETLLQREGDGYCAGFVEASPDDWYEFRLNDVERLYPDPGSRF